MKRCSLLLLVVVLLGCESESEPTPGGDNPSPDVEALERSAYSRRNLVNIGLAIHAYHDEYRQFPASGISSDEGAVNLSWQYQLLPFTHQPALLDLFHQIDGDELWTDSSNVAAYSTAVAMFIHPSEEDNTTTEDGLSLSHYAGSSHIFSPDGSISIRDITDGSSNTIMAGEVGAGFKAWGDPTNVRDPASGIDVSPETFGRGGDNPGALMLLIDGTVRFISSDIDPDTLIALSTYDGGEPVGEF